MIKSILMIVGLPGSGKTTYAKSILTDMDFFIDDPNRNRHLFDEAINSEKSRVVICDPIVTLTNPKRVEKFLMDKFGYGLDFEWIYFENDQQAAWANHLKRNEVDPRSINESFHKHMASQYVIPENATILSIYKQKEN